MKRDIYECKRCESNCLISSLPDNDGNTWPKDYLNGLLCSCSKWEILTDTEKDLSSSNYTKCSCGGSMVGSLACIECGDGIDLR